MTDALIVANLPLVRPWIVREWHRRADPQDLDDLIAEGVLGLVQAGRAYDPDRGPFWGFARSRVMGAVLDLVTRRYAKRRGRPPQLTPDLDQHSSDQSDVAGRLPEIRARVAEHLAHLPRRQRAAVLLHVVDGLPLSEVGRRIGCSESMASRLLRGVRGHAERLLVEEAA